MEITYKPSDIYINEFTLEQFYTWDIYVNGNLLPNRQRLVPVKDVSPEVWDAQQKEIKKSAEAKLVALGFTPEEATLICLNHD
jgi:hypothetical protein